MRTAILGLTTSFALATVALLAVGCDGGGSAAAPGAGGGGRCVHPYFPSRVGATWTYRAAGSEDVRVAVVSARSDSFTIRRLTGDRTSDTRWGCVTGGLRPLDMATSLGVSGGARWRTERLTGLTLPADLAAGARWSLSVVLAGLGPAAPGSPAARTRRIREERSSRVARRERVRVPAGELDAVVVEDQITRTTEADGAPEGAGRRPFRQITTTWWVRGVGWVRRETRRIDPPGATPNVTELVETSERPR